MVCCDPVVQILILKLRPPASRSEEDLGWEVLLGGGLLCRLVLSQGCDLTCVSVYKVVQKDFTIKCNSLIFVLVME